LAGGLDLRQDRVQVMARSLGLSHETVRGDPPPGGELGPDAQALSLLAEIGAPRPHRDCDLNGGALRVEPELTIASEGDRPDVTAAEAIAADQLVRSLAKLIHRERKIEVVELGRLGQPLEVLAMSEDARPALGLVGANPLKHPRPVVKPMAEYVDLGVLPRDEFAIHPDP